MKNLMVLLILSALAWYGYGKYKGLSSHVEAPNVASMAAEVQPPTAAPAARFTCDGRTHCSHMRSCEEATYFIQRCPNTKMDGDGDGVPCERQWCN
jgi:hypothetical protein